MKKTKPLLVRVTDEEHTQLEEASLRLFGRPNKSRLLRKLLRAYLGMGLDLNDEELALYRETVRQLTGIARNLNQITVRMHQQTTPDNPLTTDYIARLTAQVLAVNDAVKSHVSRSIHRLQERVNHEP